MDIQTKTLVFGKNSVSSWKLAREPSDLHPPALYVTIPSSKQIRQTLAEFPAAAVLRV